MAFVEDRKPQGGGFVENLMEGLAAAAGSEYGVKSIEQRKARRQALSDFELETQTQTILDDMHQLNERRSKLDRNSPTYQQDVADIEKQMTEARSVFTDLYHPDQQPGGLQKLYGYIQSHIRRRGQKQAPPATPAQAKRSLSDRMAGIERVAYAPQSEDAFAKANAEFKTATGRDMNEDEKRDWAYKRGGIPIAKELPTKWQPQLTETTDDAGKKHYWRVPLEEGGKPEEVDFQGQKVTPKGSAGKPKKSWSKTKDGKVYSVNVDPQTNQPIPGTENYNDIPAAGLVEHLSFGQYHFYDDKGDLHEINEERRTVPFVGGVNAPQAGAGAAAPAVAPQPDTSQYETKLTPDEEIRFQAWKKQYAPKDSGYDYDLRGAFKAGLKPDPKTGHWPDTYKKPNHPTFSDQSIYAKQRPDLAGHWQGDQYIPPSKKPSAGAPKNRAQALPPRPPGAPAPKPSGDRILAHKDTAAQLDARKKYQDASRVAKVARDAVTNPSAAKDKALGMVIVRGEAGRVSMPEINTLMSSYGLKMTLEQWVNRFESGMLPKEVRAQLANLCIANENAAKQVLDESLAGTYGHPDASTTKNPYRP